MLISSAVLAYNISYHSTTKYSPFELLYGRKPALPPLLYDILDQNLDSQNTDSYLKELTTTIIALQSKAFSNSYISKINSVQYNKEKRKELRLYSEGDRVLYHPAHSIYRQNKLAALWKGPYEIIEKTSSDAYTIKDTTTGAVINRVHAKFLRPYYQFNTDSKDPNNL